MAIPEPLGDLVVVATAVNPAQAHIYQQALEAAGIRCKVVGEYLDAGIGDIPGVEAEVWVRQKDLARAQQILRQGQNRARSDRETEAEP
jgi:hypothetical protein